MFSRNSLDDSGKYVVVDDKDFDWESLVRPPCALTQGVSLTFRFKAKLSKFF